MTWDQAKWEQGVANMCAYLPKLYRTVLRDYFAGQVLASSIDASTATALTTRCYEIADAMLKAREEV